MSGKSHGRSTVFKLDDLSGALTDISAYLDSVNHSPTTDRPETQTFGQSAKRRQVMGLRDGAELPLGGFFQGVAGTKVHGRNFRMLVDQYSLSPYFNSASISLSCDLSETQTFGQNWKRREVPGLRDGSVSLAGFLETGAGASEAVLRAALNDSDGQIFTLAPYGLAIGSLVELGQMVEGSYNVTTAENDVNQASAEFQAEGGLDLGVALHDHTAETAIGDYTSVDETAATSEGGVGHLHVTAFTGTNATFKVQHSTDNVVWVDLIAFTQVTAVGAQRIEVAGTVNRYVRGQMSAATGLTSTTFSIAFARRGYAYGTAGTYRHFRGLLQRSLTSSWEYGPEGSVASSLKLTGEARLASIQITNSENEPTKFTASLQVDGQVTESTY